MMDVKQVFNKKYLISFEADMSRFPSLPESAFHFVGRQIARGLIIFRVASLSCQDAPPPSVL
ncbi:MAG: hypothetical protein STSR0003_20310 [Smithella sp.]|jgi:hypothetical protein